MSYRVFRKAHSRGYRKFINDRINNEEFLLRIKEILNISSTSNANVYDANIHEEAKRVISGKYNILGAEVPDLFSLDWHTDFKTGFKWYPGTFYKNYKQEEINSNSDVKVPRELSRCHHLLKIALASRFANDSNYADLCTRQIVNWIDENPLMYSINWGCTMDVAIRAVNWIWTLGLMSDSEELKDDEINRIKFSLFQHGWFIWRNPEKAYFNNHNHYLADLAGQIHLGLLFKGLREPDEWLKQGKEELFREIRMQVLPSGMSYERSTHYNRLVLELILIPVLILKENNHEIPSDIWYRLEKMFEFIMYSLKPDGKTPIIGDQDNGRLLPLGSEDVNDFRYLLSLGAILYNRPDFKCQGNGYDIYCLILGGANAFERYNQIPDLPVNLESRSFPDAGLYIMRENDNYLIFNATGKSLYPELGFGTHTHSDLFSFELFTHGKSFLIDPGSYVYTADAEIRKIFRSTKMHNTVTVDGESQNVITMENLWDFDRNAVPEIVKWESNRDQDLITAVHNGYCRLIDPILHQRTIIFDKASEKWIITDTMTGNGNHVFEWYFHFDIGIDFIIDKHRVDTLCDDGKNITLLFDETPELVLNKEKSYLSKSYGQKEDGYVLVVRLADSAPIELSIEIMKRK